MIARVFLGVSAVLTTVLAAQPLAAQSVAEGYEVATWSGFSEAAVTHSFDDNTPNQLPVALPLFDHLDLKATFFVTTDWAGDQWDDFATASANGHEVAVHTLNHPELRTLSVAEQRVQLEGARDTIRARIPGIEPLTVAYPFCVPGNRELVEELFIAARVCEDQVDSPTPHDFYETSAFSIGDADVRVSANSLNRIADVAASSGGWVTYVSHGIDDDGGYSPVSSIELRLHLKYLAANPDRFWVATYIDVVRYIRERDSASVAEVSATGDQITIEITDDLSDTLYNTPLTVRRALPAGWMSATVTQDGVAVSSVVEEVNGEASIEFGVVPDGGPVVIGRSAATVTERAPEAPTAYVVAVHPNPFHNRAQLVFELDRAEPVTVAVFDLLGRRVETIHDAVLSPGRHVVTWDASHYSAGNYLYRLQAGSASQTGQITLSR